MIEDDTPEKGKTVKLTASEPATAKPKLAKLKTDPPKTVVVSVPKAAAVPVQPKAAQPENTPAVAVADNGMIKKAAILSAVAERSGIKKPDVKSVTEALLAVMGEHLLAEKDLQLPPLGKLKVMKSKPVGKGATAFTLKLRTPNAD